MRLSMKDLKAAMKACHTSRRRCDRVTRIGNTRLLLCDAKGVEKDSLLGPSMLLIASTTTRINGHKGPMISGPFKPGDIGFHKQAPRSLGDIASVIQLVI